MKTFKKLAAVLIAVVMTLGLGTKGVYAEAPTKGSVTVSPNYKDQEYTLYKLFDAKMTYNTEGELQAVTYQLPEGKTAADLIYTVPGSDPAVKKQWFKLNENNNVVAFDNNVTTDWAKDPDAIAWAKSFGATVGAAKTATKDNDPAVKWEDLDWGYYFVSTSTGSFIGVDTDNPNVTIADKNTPPTLDKEITGVKDSDGATSGSVFNATEESELTDPGHGVNEQAIAQIGDTVSYKLTVKVKPGALNYVITDTMTNLKIVASSFKVGGAAIAENVKVDAAGTTITDKASTFTIKLAQSYLDSITEETDLVITYDAILDASAAVADEANPNTAKLTYGTKPDKNFSEDSAKVWTAEVGVNKKINSATGDPLKGAGFKLYKTVAATGTGSSATETSKLYYKLDNGVVTWVAEGGDEFFTGTDGKLTTKFTGLANGTYFLEESTVPEGYNEMADTEVTIAGSDVTVANLSQEKTVVNQSGQTLPSTGGIGTTLFYVVGGALILGAGIVLTARKKAQN